MPRATRAPTTDISMAQMLRLFSCHLSLLRNSYPEIVAAAILFLAPTGVVLFTVDSQYFRSTDAASEGDFLALLVGVLTTNLPSALFLFAGVVTLGIAAGVGCVLLGLFLGFSAKMAVGTFGVGHVIAQTWLYTPLELYGFVLAGASGLVVARHTLILGEHPLQASRNACPRALTLLAHAISFLAISAVLEAAVAS